MIIVIDCSPVADLFGPPLLWSDPNRLGGRGGGEGLEGLASSMKGIK